MLSIINILSCYHMYNLKKKWNFRFSFPWCWLFVCTILNYFSRNYPSNFLVGKLNAFIFFYCSNILFSLGINLVYAETKMVRASGSFSHSAGFLHACCLIIPHQAILSNFLVSERNAVFIFFYCPNFLFIHNVNTIYAKIKIGGASSSFSYIAGFLSACFLTIPHQTILLNFLVSEQNALFVYIYRTIFLYIVAMDNKTNFIYERP